MWHISALVLLIVSSAFSYRPSDIRLRSEFGSYSSLSVENDLTSMSDFHGLLSKTDDALLGGLKICIITRGLPGRGKTTLVKKIANHYNNIGEFTAVMAAADDYMVDSSGEYCWMPENLSNAHKCCRDKLTDAMSENVDIVIQHNTNVCDWENKELRVKAEAHGYIVVFIEPLYAWQKKSELPPSLRDVLVNVHGVPEEKISDMTRRKENICPRYLQYVIKPSALIRDFLAEGISTEQLNPSSDVFAFGFGTLVNESSDLKSPDESLTSGPSATASADILNSFLGVSLKNVLHVTTDYIGNDARLLSSSDHQEIVGDLLSSCKLQIVAIYADARGVGALVTTQSRCENSEKITETKDEEKPEMKKKNWIDMIKNSDEVPRYQKYTKNKSLGNTQYSRSYGGRNRGYRGDSYQQSPEAKTVPHITIKVNPTHCASTIGEAAYEFQQRLFKNNIVTLLSQETSKASGAVTASSISKDDDIFFFPQIVKVGNFEAVLFENPVNFTGTYVGFYST